MSELLRKLSDTSLKITQRYNIALGLRWKFTEPGSSFSKACLLSPENQAFSEALLIIGMGRRVGTPIVLLRSHPAQNGDEVLTAVVPAREMTMRMISH